ncbi:glycerol-3-phosphate 1-O-acyltransferase [Sphingopyxis macrogoltabida]|uniref:Glycerol-3-phosphate acyltransferase n=1 Tax=Sphingopyxis macrogoltabida TaxID=33050 RepID=A0A0N9UXT3_SPHMC|nr:glycerol-3-phosphate 1-O-acyltransferase [Sphingopyxis macrogoltabida]ALH81754.1 glycerol-3-phosphate acyltransferase [Sphingopyxis macrogoltabida]
MADGTPRTEIVAEEAADRLYIIDARNRVERRILLDWIHATAGDLGGDRAPQWASLSIADGDHALDLDQLKARLAGAPGRQVVPLRVAWRIPGFERDRALKFRHLIFGDPRQPGPLRSQFILWRDRRRAQILVGEAATQAALKDRFLAQTGGGDGGEEGGAEYAGFVARQAGLALDVAERGIRGSRYKVPRFVADGLRTSPKFRAALAELSETLGRPVGDLYREARPLMKEVIARPSALFLDLRAKLDRMMFGGYAPEMEADAVELARLRSILREHPTCILFTHKTYIDGATPSRLLYENDMPMLHSFGGANLDIAVMGEFFRRSGMIFIRRSFQGQPVYKVVLRHYIAWLLAKRFPLSWAFEGTRSRLGKLMPPKYGLMKYVLDAAHATGTRDVHFVPFVTSFDLIRDVEEYAAEQTGRNKKPESLSWFLGYMRSLRAPSGRIRLDIGNPVVIDMAPGPDDKRALEKIAFAVAVEANRVTPLTVTSVMCLILLGTAPRGVTATELLATIAAVADWARARGIRLSKELESGDDAALSATVDTLVASGLLTRYEAGSESVYSIDPAKHPMASYYRNIIVHHFLDRAMIEIALFELRDGDSKDATAAFWAKIDRLRDLFKFEFFYPPRGEHMAALQAELERIDPVWDRRLASGDRGVAQLIRRCQPLVGHAILLPFAEAYSVVADLAARARPGEEIDEKTLLDAALVEGKQAYLLRRISSEAAIGKLLFANGLSLMRHMGMAGTATPDSLNARRALLMELRGLANVMESMRLATLALADRLPPSGG